MPTLSPRESVATIAEATARKLGPFAAVALAEQRAADFDRLALLATTSLARAAYAVESRRWREAGAALLARRA